MFSYYCSGRHLPDISPAFLPIKKTAVILKALIIYSHVTWECLRLADVKSLRECSSLEINVSLEFLSLTARKRELILIVFLGFYCQACLDMWEITGDIFLKQCCRKARKILFIFFIVSESRVTFVCINWFFIMHLMLITISFCLCLISISLTPTLSFFLFLFSFSAFT